MCFQPMASLGGLLYNRFTTGFGRFGLSFQQILEQLVAGVRGATGALLIESDGEAVAWYSSEQADRLRLRGAYVAVVLRACQESALELGMGSISNLFISYEGAGFLAYEVGSGYFLVLELNAASNMAEALHRMAPFITRIRKEIEA